MKNFNTTKIVAAAIAFTAILFTQTVFAQKYKTAADTVKLNKAYGEVTLDISRLNSNLIEEQNKTPEYDAKSASTAQNAVSSAEYSASTQLIATGENLADVKMANFQAKKANKMALDAKNNQAVNLKKIDRINDKIAKKQAELADLNGQKADIITKLPVFAPETM